MARPPMWTYYVCAGQVLDSLYVIISPFGPRWVVSNMVTWRLDRPVQQLNNGSITLRQPNFNYLGKYHRHQCGQPRQAGRPFENTTLLGQGLYVLGSINHPGCSRVTSSSGLEPWGDAGAGGSVGC